MGQKNRNAKESGGKYIGSEHLSMVEGAKSPIKYVYIIA